MILLRRGRLRAAGVVYLFGIWLMATAVIMLNRDPSSVALVYYMALPVTGAWLFGFRAALGIAGLCAGGSLILAVWWQLVPALPVFMPDTSFGTWTMVMTATIMTTAPVARVLQILKEALARGRSAPDGPSGKPGPAPGTVAPEFAGIGRSARPGGRCEPRQDCLPRRHESRTAPAARTRFSASPRWCEADPGLSEGQRKDLEIISRSGEQLLGFVNEVLDLSMIEAGYALGVPADPTAPIETESCRPELAAAEPRNDELGGLAPGQPEQRILIVEDPREGSGLLQHLLRNAGFRVAVDEDGIEGVESFRAWRPDLIWIDLCLPGESGVEAARRVRRLDWEDP